MLSWKKTTLAFSNPAGRTVYTMNLSGEEFLKIEVSQHFEGEELGDWYWNVFGKISKKGFKTADLAKDDALNMAEMMLGEAIYTLGQRVSRSMQRNSFMGV